MAKIPNSVIGIDLGRYSLKSVSLQRKGANRFVLNNYAVRVMENAPQTAEQLGAELKLLLKEMGGGKKCAVAVSSPDSLIRIIDQPETPIEILRDAVRLNGMSLLNQDVKEFALDCEQITKRDPSAPAAPVRYLVCGLPRTHVSHVDEAFQEQRKNPVHNIQLAPVSAFNAFEFANEQIFNNEAFLLVDIGHSSSTVTVGVKRELVLVRAIEFGGQSIMSAVISTGAKSTEEALRQLDEKDEIAVETARLSLTVLTREISSSIGFFEGRREETISKVFVSGSIARSKALLEILSEELHMPCEAWNPFQACEMSLPAHRRQLFQEDFVSLNVACGAAAEALKGK